MLKTPKRLFLLTLLAFSFFAILILNSKTATNFVRSRSTDFGAAGLKVLYKTTRSAKRIIPFASLRDENRLLRQKLDLLTTKVHEAKLVLNENERLRTLLDFKKEMPYSTVAAQVIGRDPTNWSNSLIIDKGALHGIRPNKAVLSQRGVVGRVFEVGRYSSKVLLITDPNSKVGVIIERNRQGGLLVGRPDGKCKMLYIALDSDVAPGDKVATAEFSSVFPKNIVVGEVVKVDKEKARLYKYAIVKPAEHLSKLEEVLCVR